VTTTMQELPGAEWLEYFASPALGADGVLVAVAVIRDASAHPRRARPLKAIDYDPGADTLEIVTDGCITGDGTLRYFIAAPRRITVAESAGAGAILVEDAGGIRTLIRLFNLPRPLDRDEPPAQVAQMTSRNGDRERSW